MKGTTFSSNYWRKWSCSFFSCVIGFTFGVIMNYQGIIFENIRVSLDVSVFDNLNSTNAASMILTRWPHFEKNLLSLVNISTGKAYVVPNIIHFIWFANNDKKEMKFINYVSISSAYKIHKPDVIMFHCNFLPSGKWWETLWRSIPLKIVYRKKPSTIHGQNIIHTFHKGDVAKIEILMEYGGIYLDYDVLVVNSLNPLRRYDACLGKEKPPKLIAGIIIAQKNSLFLKMLHESYKNNYRPYDWDYNCARVAYQIALQRPDLIHVESRRLTTPDWQDRKQLWREIIDWSDLYVIHIMGHFDFQEHTPESIKSLNSTFGEVMRYLYYGSPKLILK
ncbi:hypothetical protein HELRODRAFT_189210 [Helobdella robusta]|uniref:Alpha-1,4-N-acetylglucosaminyltransferase n=1 Tax=Helobdella robusta TaxID=6412 RepID=T1FQS8_HELRO|nr:hypothetical protein HELRODRAFT_189210 [Helobdella robusta]ESN96353.1 hypothetical protein HELRODRAFT_189210 [Helobdella robusta]